MVRTANLRCKNRCRGKARLALRVAARGLTEHIRRWPYLGDRKQPDKGRGKKHTSVEIKSSIITIPAPISTPKPAILGLAATNPPPTPPPMTRPHPASPPHRSVRRLRPRQPLWAVHRSAAAIDIDGDTAKSPDISCLLFSTKCLGIRSLSLQVHQEHCRTAARTSTQALGGAPRQPTKTSSQPISTCRQGHLPSKRI